MYQNSTPIITCLHFGGSKTIQSLEKSHLSTIHPIKIYFPVFPSLPTNFSYSNKGPIFHEPILYPMLVENSGPVRKVFLLLDLSSGTNYFSSYIKTNLLLYMEAFYLGECWDHIQCLLIFLKMHAFLCMAAQCSSTRKKNNNKSFKLQFFKLMV